MKNFKFFNFYTPRIVILIIINFCWFNSYSQKNDELKVVETILNNANYIFLDHTFSYNDLEKYDINLEDLNYWNPCKYKFEKDQALLTEKEYKFLNDQFQNLNKVKLDIESSKLTDKVDLNNSRQSSITYPILFRNNEYAVYYSEQRYGGQITLMKKENDKWILYCSYIIWIE